MNDREWAAQDPGKREYPERFPAPGHAFRTRGDGKCARCGDYASAGHHVAWFPQPAEPTNAPEHIDDDTDARHAWADGWNACLADVKRRQA